MQAIILYKQLIEQARKTDDANKKDKFQLMKKETCII